MYENTDTVVRDAPLKLHNDKSNSLKKRLSYIFIVLNSEFITKETPVKLDVFERYLKSCNNDGHRLIEVYWDSDNTKLMTRHIVDKNGRNDGPCLRYSDDGNSVSFGWYRRGKTVGKWVTKHKTGDISLSEAIYDKNGEKISPHTVIYEGRLDKFIYNTKNGQLLDIIKNGKPDSHYKRVLRHKIEQLQQEGKSGTVKVDEQLAAVRAKIHRPQTQQQETKEIDVHSFEQKNLKHLSKDNFYE